MKTTNGIDRSSHQIQKHFIIGIIKESLLTLQNERTRKLEEEDEETIETYE